MLRLARFAFVPCALLLACGGPPAATPIADATPEPAATKPATPSAPAATAAAEPNAPDTCGSVEACAETGLVLAQKGDPSARTALEKACRGPVYSADACAVLALLLVKVPGTDPARHVEVAERGCAKSSEVVSAEIRGIACLLAGSGYQRGLGVTADAKKAERAFSEGCALGNQKACELSRAADDESGVPGANLRMERLASGSTVVQQVACRTDGGLGGGLFGAIALVQPFQERQAKLSTCGKARDVRVRWKSNAGRMADVKVISAADASNGCVERALTGAAAPIDGMCAATVKAGKK